MLVYQLSVHDKWSISMIPQKKIDCHHPPAQALYLNSAEVISLQSNASCVSDFKTTFSDVRSEPPEWKNTIFPILSAPTWFINFEAFSLIFDWAPFEVGIHCFLQCPHLWCLQTMTQQKRGTCQLFNLALFHSRAASFLSACSGNRKELIKTQLPFIIN